MLTGDFQTSLSTYILKEDFDNAQDLLMNELGGILVRDKQDFIDMLNESDIEADASMSDNQLIELFADNVDNRQMLLGASLLTQMHNKKMGFDGENEISDDGVKSGYAVMNTYFNFDDEDDIREEDYSYIAPMLFGALFKGAKKLLGGRQRNRDSGGGSQRDSQRDRDIARQRMIAAARREQERRVAEAKAKAEAEAKAKKKTTTIIIVSSIIVVGIVATILILKRKK